MSFNFRDLNIDPKDLAQLEQMLEEYEQYLPIIKAILQKTLPELIDTLSPLAKEFIEGTARMNWHYYESLQELGFDKTQAFDLLLSWETRMERALKQIRNAGSPIKINTEKKQTQLDL